MRQVGSGAGGREGGWAGGCRRDGWTGWQGGRAGRSAGVGGWRTSYQVSYERSAERGHKIVFCIPTRDGLCLAAAAARSTAKRLVSRTVGVWRAVHLEAQKSLWQRVGVERES